VLSAAAAAVAYVKRQWQNGRSIGPQNVCMRKRTIHRPTMYLKVIITRVYAVEFKSATSISYPSSHTCRTLPPTTGQTWLTFAVKSAPAIQRRIIIHKITHGSKAAYQTAISE